MYKRQPPDRDEVSLEIQEELNRELDEINSLGVSKEAEYLSLIHISANS